VASGTEDATSPFPKDPVSPIGKADGGGIPKSAGRDLTFYQLEAMWSKRRPTAGHTGPNGAGGLGSGTAIPRSSPELVLLVEDDEDNRAMYRCYLEWEGFRVVEATDGLQALGQAAAATPAVIVMDLALPRLDGWQAVRRLKADPRTRHIPVIALTAHAFVGDAKQAKAAGCDGYLAKPCLPEDLSRAIRSFIRATRSGGRRDPRQMRAFTPWTRRQTARPA
jgi:two-component system cell cycle response regulator DivK